MSFFFGGFMSNKIFRSFFILLFIISLLFCIFTYIFSLDNISYVNTISDFSSLEFIWPVPGYTTITSNFGYRNAPTSGASKYHSGIDIAVPTSTNILSICDGIVIFTGFNGAGGYTVTIEENNYKISYCHVSPFFIVHIGQKVYKGNVIAYVGPKNVYGVLNNPYKDSKR
jgi:septal ring factor EnvC (AmiA/AmiB activator)